MNFKNLFSALFLLIMLSVGIFGYETGFIGNSRYLRVDFHSEEDLRHILKTNLIIDRILPGEKSFTCYAEKEHVGLFDSLGLIYEDIPTSAELYRDKSYRQERLAYRTWTQIVNELTAISQTYPQYTELLNIGTSVQGRPLYFLRITSNIQSDPVKPEFHYISTIHGNEPVGTEMCMEFINYLLYNYGSDDFVTSLMDDLDIYVMPVMNPDGFVASTRSNANGYDLNRNFPDFTSDPEDTPSGKQIETAALMQFYAQRRGVLSANFHTGALVVNYPWDTTYADHPENDMLIQLSLRYSSFNSPMYNSYYFEDGITNGADWYVIEGGMQDYACYYHSNTQVTVELSDSFAPPSNTLPQLWQDNKYSMLNYCGAMRRGVQGYVLDSITHQPVSAEFTVNGIDWVFESDPASGLFHKMLLPGTYTITFTAEGYYDKTINGVVIGNDWNITTFLGNVYMQSDSPQDIPVPVYRFFNHVRGGHLYTISETERDTVMELPSWTYEGIKFNVFAQQAENTCAVYRFFNTNTGIHFYTINPDERDAVMELPQYNYEGVKYYVYNSQIGASIPVYRFFNHVRGGHLYTISETERDAVMELPSWTYEGIAFYVIGL